MTNVLTPQQFAHLHYACAYESAEVVLLFLSQFSSPVCEVQFVPLVHNLAKSKRWDGVAALLTHAKTTRASMDWYMECIEFAMCNDSHLVVQCLLQTEHFQLYNVKSTTVESTVRHAIRTNAPRCLSVLLKHFRDVFDIGLTKLMLRVCITFKSARSLRLVLKWLCAASPGLSTFALCVFLGSQWSECAPTSTLVSLLDNGAVVDRVGLSSVDDCWFIGDTPPPLHHYAVSPPTLKVLLARGACANQSDSRNSLTLLYVAVRTRRPDACRMLLQHGAIPDTICNQWRNQHPRRHSAFDLAMWNLFTPGRTPCLVKGRIPGSCFEVFMQMCPGLLIAPAYHEVLPIWREYWPVCYAVEAFLSCTLSDHDAAVTRFTHHTTFDPNVLALIAGFSTGLEHRHRFHPSPGSE